MSTTTLEALMAQIDDYAALCCGGTETRHDSGRAALQSALSEALADKVQPAEPPSPDFIRRTNDEYAAWCRTYYVPEALDERGMQSLHGLWAWQEQERRKMAAPPVAPAAPVAPQGRSLRNELQKKCVDMGAYWQALDAHGVDVTVDQAEELLRDALGVEVSIIEIPAASPAPAAAPAEGAKCVGGHEACDCRSYCKRAAPTEAPNDQA